METTNHLDSATSQALVSDGHHSSLQDALVCGAPEGGDEGRCNGSGDGRGEEISSEEPIRGRECDAAAGNERGDAKRGSGRRGRVARGDSDGCNGAAALDWTECPKSGDADDGFSARGETTQRATREARPQFSSWPEMRPFDWETPCVEKVTGSVARVGQAVGRFLRRGERRRGDRTSRDVAKEERIEKKRALNAYLECGGKETGHVLQGTVFALNSEGRTKWSEKLGAYWSVLREEKRGNAKKKPRIEKVNGMAAVRSINGNAELSGRETKQHETKCRSMSDSLELKDLIEAGLVETGKGVVKVAQDGVEYSADLMKEGHICFNEHTFASPNDFALFIERQTTPFADRDDAWKRVVVSGRPLDDWKMTQTSNSPETSKPKKVSADSTELDDHP